MRGSICLWADPAGLQEDRGGALAAFPLIRSTWADSTKLARSVGRGRIAERHPGQNSIVQLDLPTLVVMGSFASACAGVALLVAWWQNRKVPALALWALGNFFGTAGISA
jgi:hypothetical protein